MANVRYARQIADYGETGVIVLVGFMAAGKTTVGNLIAEQLGLPFFDTDAIIERRHSSSIAELFAAHGEMGFRDIERSVVLEMLDGADAVVALGGGSVGDPVAAARLEWATVVHLGVTAGEAMRRIAASARGRPMLERADPVGLLQKRVPLYNAAVDRSRDGFSVETVGRTPEEVAAEIVTRLGGPGGGTHRLGVAVADRSYQVVITHEAKPSLVADEIPLPLPERALVVTVQALEEPAGLVTSALAARGVNSETFVMPEGETTKTIRHAEILWNKLATGEFHRNDALIAMGGGALCDLCGFVAATFHRGMRLVLVPTTLLAQADAAIGGKNAINLAVGKNLVGTFHQPELVICDTELLTSLPREELSSGLAEVVKHGLIADPELVEVVRSTGQKLLDADAAALVHVVARSASIKSQFVTLDERDRSVRACLNYGHTFGHAIEHVSRGSVRHGEAVSLGMMAAAYAAQDIGYLNYEDVQLHEDALRSVGLPVRANYAFEDLQAIWRLDKKYQGGVRFVLLRGIGKPESDVAVDEHVLRSSVARLAS